MNLFIELKNGDAQTQAQDCNDDLNGLKQQNNTLNELNAAINATSMVLLQKTIILLFDVKDLVLRNIF